MSRSLRFGVCWLLAHAVTLSPTPVVAVDLVTPRPQPGASGELWVSKSLQRQLGIRTAVVGSQAPAQRLRLVAEVVADPLSLGSIKAPQAGTLESAERWVLPGQGVEKGEVLAWLRPQMAQRELSRRRLELARIEQKLLIAQMNYERLRMQAEGLGEAAPNNVYFEQAELERQALQKQQALARQGMVGRVPVRAPASGVLVAAPVRAGEVVAAGQSLFEIADPIRLQLAAISHDPALVSAPIVARLRVDAQSEPLMLSLRGGETLSGQPGWRLLFDIVDPPPALLLPGAMRDIEIEVAGDGSELLRQACVRLPDGAAVLWLHVAPERFEPRRLPSCEVAWSTALAGERWVLQGGALLQQYR